MRVWTAAGDAPLSASLRVPRPLDTVCNMPAVGLPCRVQDAATDPRSPLDAPPRSLARGRFITFSIHAIVFATLAAWSWRKWPDPLIDFGRELYVPWQITQGAVLYRDIASLFGPLSPYANALGFRVFGVSLTTLIFCNLTIFAAVLAGIFHLVRISSDRLVATLVTLSVMLLFGFGQYLPIGNYNFLSPYSHEATHGFALSVAMVVALHHAVAGRRRTLFAIAGLCFGGVLLTKPEISVAAAIAATTGFVAMHILDGGTRRSIALAIAMFLAGAAVPALGFFAYFRMHMPAAAAARAVAGAWTAVIGGRVVTSEFYRRVTGLDAPVANALRMLWMCAGFAAFVGLGVLIALRTGTPSATPVAPRWRIARLAFLAAVTLVLPFNGFPRAFPLTTLTAFAVFAMTFVRRRADRASALRVFPMLMWSAFAFVLLAKMGLNARVVHYGFYLALPATTVMIVLLAWVVPQALHNWSAGAAAQGFRTIAIWAVVAAIVPYLGRSYGIYRLKTIPIGAGADRFYALDAPPLWHGAAARDALAQIRELSPPGSTVAVLPEGVMLNYLSRRQTPLRVINLMPPELLAFGEANVLRSLVDAPPELILLVRRDVSEYGYPPFGTDPKYGQAIAIWIRGHYNLLRIVSALPDQEGESGIEILRRRQLSAP